MEIFDILKEIKEGKSELNFTDDSVKKAYSPFLINRFISMTDLYVPIANEINKYPDIPDSAHYMFYRDTLPKRRTYDKYIKKSKEVDADQKKFIAEYYEIGVKEVDDYLRILSDDQVDEILKKYIHGRGSVPKL